MPTSARELFEDFGVYLDPARTVGEHAVYRFDVEGAGSWRVTIEDGTISAVESDDDAQCVIRISEPLLLELAMGKANALSAFLTGEMQVEGDVSLAGKFEKFRPFRWTS
jgi:putative sterol carrier protein